MPTPISAFALSLLDLLAPARCPGCDSPVLGGPAFCGACALLLEPVLLPDAAYHYGGPLRDGIHRLKYGGRRDLAPALAGLLSEHLRADLRAVDCIVPMPLHASRLAERGFNQAALLAWPLAHDLGVPIVPRRLERIRPTSPQVGLDVGARRRNVRGAFRARADAARPRVLLIDDVRTTGATLEAAADALREAGASEVIAVALAAAERSA